MFIILCPFICKNKFILNIHLTLLYYFLFKWLINDKNAKCGLTMLEYHLLNKSYHEGFVYRIIKPLVYIEEKELNNMMIIIILFLIYLNKTISKN